MSPMEEFEEDLGEIKSCQPYARRLFWTGATPFAMSYENLKLRALTVRDYLIKCQTMAMFASIRDIKSKEVWQLKKLRAMGINGLSIGTESGDDDTLTLFPDTELYRMEQEGQFVPAITHVPPSYHAKASRALSNFNSSC